MRAVIALMLGGLGVTFVIAGVQGTGTNLYRAITSKNPPPDQYPKLIQTVLAGNNGLNEAPTLKPGGSLNPGGASNPGGLLPGI